MIIKSLYGSELLVVEGADLRDADLRDADLRGANLRHTDLRDADLRHADLRGADLRDADLRGANIRHADLRYTDLRYTDLRGANLRHADLRYTDLRYTDLRGANLRDCIGDGYTVRTLQLPPYTVVVTKDIISIGCRTYTVEEWGHFTNDEIDRMDVNALKWWTKWKSFIKEVANDNK